MSKENLSIWDAVSETDPAYTKQVNQRGGYTTIDAQYQLMNATKEFGPYGKTWGFKDIDLDYTLIAKGLVIFKGVFFFPGGQFPIINCKSIGEKKVDEDFAKKLETNTLSKALSKLGFNADIFMGKFEDFDYVNMALTKSEIKKADDEGEAVEKALDELEAWIVQEVETYKMLPAITSLNPVYSTHKKKAELRCKAVGMNPKATLERFQAAYMERRNELEPSDSGATA